ncbi:MAG TPA: hypothetical protein VGF76_03195 [Polyangiaceae bacterium]
MIVLLFGGALGTAAAFPAAARTGLLFHARSSTHTQLSDGTGVIGDGIR